MNYYNVIDLFAGCGGLSEGFEKAGFNIVAQVEKDIHACNTLGTRHLFRLLKEIGELDWYYKYVRGEVSKEFLINEKFPFIGKHIKERVLCEEITKENENKIFEKIEQYSEKIHVIIGGPPCQGFSTASRAIVKKNGFKDKRNYLIIHFFNSVNRFKPDFFVFENVPGFASMSIDGINTFDLFIDSVYDYELLPTNELARKNILNSADFGVPQNRRRFILVGCRKDLLFKYPDVRNFYSVLNEKKVKKKTTVADAISDLPFLRPGEGSEGWFGEYEKKEDLTDYQKLMRIDSPGIMNHRARNIIPDYAKRFSYLIEFYNKNGKHATLDDMKHDIPDVSPAGHTLNYHVQPWNKPANTIIAHISKDKRLYIHPDIRQCRSFTVREAARCQSFPDNFKFEGPEKEQFKQIGNAVPPLLAEVIANVLNSYLDMFYGKGSHDYIKRMF